jgi:hypothetical protein
MTKRPTNSCPRFAETPYGPGPAILALALLLTATAILAGEVSFTETDSSLRLDNGLVAVEFDRKDGASTSLTHRSIDGSLVGRDKIGPGELLLREIGCDDPWVFTALRRDGNRVGLLVSWLAAVESTARLSLDLPGRTLLGVQLVDPVTGEKVPIRDGVVTLKPFQTLVGRLGE